MASAPVSRSSAQGPIQAVRRFNRFYTRQIGVLEERLLNSEFSLAQVRLLYELAHRQSTTAVELCRDLGMDRAYVSRTLAEFADRRWITATPATDDRRRNQLSLTRRGRHAFAPLDRRSTQDVAALLASLTGAQQQRLVASMCDIERLLNRANEPPAITLRAHLPGDIGWVVQRHGELYWQEWRYDERFEALVAGICAKFVENFDVARERCWIAERNSERLGCIFLVKQSRYVAKLRMLLVEPSARGTGLGSRLVGECCAFARAAGYRKIVLWTQSELLPARRLYKEFGFKLKSKAPNRSWGRTDLVSEVWELKL